jgi:hypothetical protein
LEVEDDAGGSLEDVEMEEVFYLKSLAKVLLFLVEVFYHNYIDVVEEVAHEVLLQWVVDLDFH